MRAKLSIYVHLHIVFTTFIFSLFHFTKIPTFIVLCFPIFLDMLQLVPFDPTVIFPCVSHFIVPAFMYLLLPRL